MLVSFPFLTYFLFPLHHGVQTGSGTQTASIPEVCKRRPAKRFSPAHDFVRITTTRPSINVYSVIHSWLNRLYCNREKSWYSDMQVLGSQYTYNLLLQFTIEGQEEVRSVCSISGSVRQRTNHNSDIMSLGLLIINNTVLYAFWPSINCGQSARKTDNSLMVFELLFFFASPSGPRSLWNVHVCVCTYC
jgi:hypothetical protein